MKIENKQIGVLIALVIGFVLLMLPDIDKSKYSFNPQAMAKVIVEKGDQIYPKELSSWIIEGKNNYQLIDIRSGKEFDEGHIKGAQNIPLEKLLLKKTISSDLSDTRIVIIYSNGNSHAHQAFLVLKAAGKDVFVLSGGFNGWNKMILNPKLPVNGTDDEILRYKKDKAVANFFGGSSSKDGIKSESAGSEIKMKVNIKRKRKKKKLEGC